MLTGMLSSPAQGARRTCLAETATITAIVPIETGTGIETETANADQMTAMIVTTAADEKTQTNPTQIVRRAKDAMVRVAAETAAAAGAAEAAAGSAATDVTAADGTKRESGINRLKSLDCFRASFRFSNERKILKTCQGAGEFRDSAAPGSL